MHDQIIVYWLWQQRIAALSMQFLNHNHYILILYDKNKHCQHQDIYSFSRSKTFGLILFESTILFLELKLPKLTSTVLSLVHLQHMVDCTVTLLLVFIDFKNVTVSLCFQTTPHCSRWESLVWKIIILSCRRITNFPFTIFNEKRASCFFAVKYQNKF